MKQYEKTGALIASVRKEKGLTQKELAVTLHVSDTTVSKWERGIGFPDVSLVEPLAAALGLTIGELFAGERAAEPLPQECEALLSGVVVSFAMRLPFSLSADFSLLIAAIATATAPASTMMTVRQYNAKGPFVDALMQVVALDDVICLFVYCVAATVVGAEDGPGVWEIVLPVVWNIAALSVGAGCGFLLSKLLKPSRSSDSRLSLAVAMLLDISLLLACMLFSAVYINRTDDRELFAQLNGFTPPIMSIFFVLSGMSLDLRALAGAAASAPSTASCGLPENISARSQAAPSRGCPPKRATGWA